MKKEYDKATLKIYGLKWIEIKHQQKPTRMEKISVRDCEGDLAN